MGDSIRCVCDVRVVLVVHVMHELGLAVSALQVMGPSVVGRMEVEYSDCLCIVGDYIFII